MGISRRQLLKRAALASAGLQGRSLFGSPLFQQQRSPATETAARYIAPGPFQPTWESLKQYKTPDWFRDAKFGIWAHWTAQCVPEAGDWYARQMYIQGNRQYDHHLKHYGHPSKTGFMEIDHLWKAERWQPQELMQLYVKAGAKYFQALANHHDNFDCFSSRHHAWNSTRVGPMKDLVGTWANLAKEHGLRLGASNHSAHAWHWLQTAYGYDAVGPEAGARYDAFRLRKEDGKGLWWEGLDPQELYVGPNMVMPDGITSIQEAQQWHEHHDRLWTEEPPTTNLEFVRTWYLRCQELLDTYQPDLLYFDDYGLPLGQAGLDITAHHYNRSIERHGSLQAIVTVKNIKPDHLGATMLDIERGRANGILAEPWQTDTCIGEWHYDRSVFEQHRYKTAKSVVQTLVDIVSKNGNLMLNIPLRGDGTIDEDEHKFLTDLAPWMEQNGEAIYGTRPYRVFGEGPPDIATSSDFNEGKARAYTAEDIRFTTKGEQLYAIAMALPENGQLTVKTLAREAGKRDKPILRVELLGAKAPLQFVHGSQGLTISLPGDTPSRFAYSFRIT